MSIRDDMIQKVLGNPGKYSIQQLQAAMKSGSLPAYVVVPIIKDKVEQQKQMQASMMLQQQQPKQPPIAQQVMQEAQGVEQLPSNLPQEYAGGGIVAFEDGGMVEHYTGGGATKVPWDRIVPAILGIPITEEELEEERIKKEQEKILEEVRLDRLREAQKPKAGIETLVPSPSAPVTNTSAAEMAIPGMGGYETPAAAQRRTLSDAETQQVLDQMRAKGMRVGLDTYKDVQAGRIPPELSATSATPAAAPAGKPPAGPGVGGPGAGAAPAGITGFVAPTPKPYRGPSATDIFGTQVYGTETEPGYLAKSTARQAEKDRRIQEAEGKVTGKAYEGLEADLRKEAEAFGADKEQAKNMAIFKAGLAMMAGTSRHALQNIGAGAMVGAEDYQKAANDIKKAQKENQRMMAQIEQARRAEDIGNRDRAIARYEKAAEFEENRDRFLVSGFASAGVKDIERALEEYKINLDSATRIGAENIRASSREDIAALRGLLGGEKGGMTQKQRGDTLRELETSKPVMDYKKRLLEQRGANAEKTPEFKQAVSEFIQQEYKRLYGDRGVPSGSPSGVGLTQEQIDLVKKYLAQ